MTTFTFFFIIQEIKEKENREIKSKKINKKKRKSK